MPAHRHAAKAAAVAALLAATPALGGDARFEDARLPRCWSRTRTVTVAAAQRDAIGAKLGARLTELINYHVDAAGQPLQVNVVRCASPEDARKALDALLASGMPAEKFVRRDVVVYEFRYQNARVADKMKDLMGLYDRSARTYRVRVDVAPLDRGDDSRWNDLFNALVALGRESENQDAVMRVLDLGAHFRFRKKLALRMERPAWGAPAYTFDPAPAAQERLGDAWVATFAQLPLTAAVPVVRVEATVPVAPFSPYAPGEPIDVYHLTRATDPWPMAHREVHKAFLEPVDSLVWNPYAPLLDRIEYILCWVNRKVAFAGEKVGSRYGTVRVLEQRYGHCWDQSDAFISICRRAKIPARQAGGWLYDAEGPGTGHIWAQVYSDSLGWLSVDPTCSWIGVTEDYVPLWISETGHPPLVYASMPEITIVEE